MPHARENQLRAEVEVAPSSVIDEVAAFAAHECRDLSRGLRYPGVEDQLIELRKVHGRQDYFATRTRTAIRSALPMRGDNAAMAEERYLLADQPSELERLQLQSRVWEPAGRELLSKVEGGSGARVLDVGCGALGWLRILSEWVSPSGQVVGTDIDESLLDAARSFLEAEGISNAELLVDDLFESKLEPQSFDLVHARYVIAPLGRGREQVASHRELVRPGGSLVLEEWDLGSWHFNPPAPAAERLIHLLTEIFATLGGEAGRGLPELLGEIGIEEPGIDAHVIALKPGHPYLRLPLQFSIALESRLLETLSRDELSSLRSEAEAELTEPGRWGTTFTLIQSWGRVEG